MHATFIQGFMDKPWKHVKWKKPITKDHIVWFSLYEMYRIGKSVETDSRLLVPRNGMRVEEWWLKDLGCFTGDDKNVLKFMIMMVI